jgi:hypothetical protein
MNDKQLGKTGRCSPYTCLDYRLNLRFQDQKLRANFGDQDERIWNSQNYTVFLAFLLLAKGCEGTRLRNLAIKLSLKQWAAFNNATIGYHIAAMVAMVVTAPTGPVGPLAAWTFGACNMFGGNQRVAQISRQASHLVQKIPKLRRLLSGNKSHLRRNYGNLRRIDNG